VSWRLTVAAVIEREGRFLVVEETDGVNPERVLNQPAGHVEPGESLLDAIMREVKEETGLDFKPKAFLGLYQLQARNGRDYARVCFAGQVGVGEAVPQDPHILACHWATPEEIALRPRSSLVLTCLEDYRAGRLWPLDLAGHFQSDRDSQD
jgi:ADP-ribose pyrophosphatase YjhB (NUDIX family)